MGLVSWLVVNILMVFLKSLTQTDTFFFLSLNLQSCAYLEGGISSIGRFRRGITR